MANKMKSNPEGCWKKGRDKPADCKACYWSQVRDGQWTGSQRCWNSQCLVLDR